MAEPHSILVTGVSGTVGGEVARQLAAAGVRCAGLARDPASLAARVGQLVELRAGDYRDAASLDRAFAGVDRVLLVAPLAPDLAELEIAAIDAAARCGVRHVVKLSTAGVAQRHGDRPPRQYALHRRSEERLEGSGLAFTHLRPAPFMQNTLSFAPAIAAEGAFRGAWGDGRLAYVDVRDVAAVAVRALYEDRHEGRAYELTGPEALAPADLARTLSSVTGRTIRYVDVPANEVRRALRDRGMDEWFAGAMAEVMEHARAGGAGHVTDAVERTTGRAPTSFAQFAREHSERFVGS